MGAFANLTYHVIFATRYRKPAIAEDFRERLYEYIGGTIRSVKGHAIQIGGVEDHVHLLMNLPPARAVSEVVRDIKANASKWINELSLIDDRFEWQKGYGAFTVSYSRIGSVQRYIQNQAEHHRTKTFEEESSMGLRPRLHAVAASRLGCAAFAAAVMDGSSSVHGLTPTATCCRRFAAQMRRIRGGG